MEQNLRLGLEPDAHVQVQSDIATSLGNGIIAWGGDGHVAGGYEDPKTDKVVALYDQKMNYAIFNREVPGQFATVTLTNLHNSDYIDPATGKKINIAKIVMHWSNLKFQPGSNQVTFAYHPLVGVDMFGASSVDLTGIDFFDKDGNKINYVPGTAWLMVTSLSCLKNSEGKKIDYEVVQALNGDIGYQTNSTANHGGPMATYHNDGRIYADTSDAEMHGAGDSGEAVIRLTPGGTIRYTKVAQDHNPGVKLANGGIGGAWYQFTISTYMEPTKRNPQPKRTVHYHYDVAEKEAKLER